MLIFLSHRCIESILVPREQLNQGFFDFRMRNERNTLVDIGDVGWDCTLAHFGAASADRLLAAIYHRSR